MKNETLKIKCYTEKDQRYHEKTLKSYGYKRTTCSMWVDIYEKEGGTHPVALIREW